MMMADKARGVGWPPEEGWVCANSTLAFSTTSPAASVAERASISPATGFDWGQPVRLRTTKIVGAGFRR